MNCYNMRMNTMTVNQNDNICDKRLKCNRVSFLNGKLGFVVIDVDTQKVVSYQPPYGNMTPYKGNIQWVEDYMGNECILHN